MFENDKNAFQGTKSDYRNYEKNAIEESLQRDNGILVNKDHSSKTFQRVFKKFFFLLKK